MGECLGDGRELGRGAADGVEAVTLGWGLAGVSAGLIVNTESIMPATRHTARMLAISGMMPACDGMMRRSRRFRLAARTSRR